MAISSIVANNVANSVGRVRQERRRKQAMLDK